MMELNRNVAAAIVLSVVLGIAALTAGAAPVVAQDDGIPSLPAAYHGELTLSDGELDQRVKVDAVADGEVQATLITDTDGAFGGPTISDAKMEVQEPESGQVEFHIGGEAVTIEAVDGEPVNAESIPFEGGDQRVELSADSDVIQPNASISLDTNSPVEAGEDLTVDVTVENTGPVAISDTIELRDFEGNAVDDASLSVPIGESTETTLTWSTSDEMTGTEEITVQVGEQSASSTVEVERIEPPQIAPPPSSGGGGGSQPGGDTGGTTTTTTSGEVTTTANTTEEPDTGGTQFVETQTIVSSDDFNMSQVRFTETAPVVSITWDGTHPAANVTVTSINQTPNGTSSAPGAAVTYSDVTVPDSLTSSSATVQFRVSPGQLDALDAEADNLRIFHYTDEKWTALDTRVVEESDEVIRLQTVTPGFSVFAVSAVSEPEADFAVDPQTPTEGEEFTLDASATSTQYGEIVAYDWTVDGESFTGETVSTSIAEPGEADIELVVENDAGETATATTTIQVAESQEPTTTAPTTTTTTTTTDTSTPGMTIGGALLALVLSGLIARRSLD